MPPTYMLAPEDSLKMISNLDEAHISKGPKFHRMCSKVHQIPNEYTKNQGPSSKKFRGILLTSLKWQKLLSVIIPEKKILEFAQKLIR